MSNSEIYNVCNQLVSEGKEPSVALIKARLVKKQPLPLLIAGLQQWKNDPNKVVEVETPETPLEPLSLEQRVEQLEQLVGTLRQELDALKKRT